MILYTIYLFILLSIQLFDNRDDISGEYHRKEKSATCQIKIKTDSTFNYCKRYAWCFEVTNGKWMLNSDTLILSSVADPLNKIERRQTLSNYIIFNNKKLLIKRGDLIEISHNKKLKKGKKYKKLTGK